MTFTDPVPSVLYRPLGTQAAPVCEVEDKLRNRLSSFVGDVHVN